MNIQSLLDRFFRRQQEAAPAPITPKVRPIGRVEGPQCPRCSRELIGTAVLEGSPLCRRCTVKLTVPLSLGLERDALMRQRASAAALADVNGRFALAIETGLPKLREEWNT